MYNIIIFEGLFSKGKLINHVVFNREKVSLEDHISRPTAPPTLIINIDFHD
jgi:hypothetical protein